MNAYGEETIESRLKNNEFLVPCYFDGPRKVGTNIGDDYLFNWETYRVIEICQDDLDGFCWIARKE